MRSVSQVKRSSIDVLIRLRPMRAELQETKPAWEISDSTLCEKGNPDTLFTFDFVYPSDATTKELYERSIRSSIVANVVKGYNGTVFAYGQTGSGKSYTMFGGDSIGAGDSLSSGLVALSVRDLFSGLEQEQKQNLSMQVSVFVTMVEIYNEQLRDLLQPSLTGATVVPLSIRENEHGVYVHNAIKREVFGERECIQLIKAHSGNRVSASTAMNEHSSRSHCVIRVLVEKTIFLEEDSEGASCSEDEDEGGLKKKIVATLNLVDLAGSERVAKTGSTGLRMVEGGHINKSLSILTTVISRLTEIYGNTNSSGAGSGFVPYRDSRLTHLLKTAIGGNSLTAVLCCITPAVEHVDESRSTLQFAARVKAIKNRVSINEVMNPRTKLCEIEAQLRRCRRMLVTTTLHLWSKSVRNKNLEKRIDDLLVLHSKQSPVSASAGSAVSQTPANEEERIVIEQLTHQNELLQQQLADAWDTLKRCSGGMSHTYVDPYGVAPQVASNIIGLADDDEKQKLRADVRDLEQMLKEAIDDKQAIQQSMDELDNFCKELEEESVAQATSVKKLQERCNELQAIVDTNKKLDTSAEGEVMLLRDQLAKTQSRLLEKGRSDEYLQQLTRLHIEHQELQYKHHQLQEKHVRELNDECLKLKEVHDKMKRLEDEMVEMRDENKLQNSYLWRLLSLASVITDGKAADPDEIVSTVHGSQVDAAVKTLTTFVLSSLEKPHSSFGSSEDEHKTKTKQQQQRYAKEEEIRDEEGRCTSDSVAKSNDEATLLKRIEELQRQIVARDAQRDVIVDCKLKCMQNLVLRLHTSNAALIEEMRRSFSLNEELFRFVDNHPKLAPKLVKAGITPMSFKAALERVKMAKIPAKPYGHN